MTTPKSFSENQPPNFPGAVVEWQSGTGRTFRFAVARDGLVMGSAPGADIRLGQADPQLLASFYLGTSENHKESGLYCRILAPHCPLMLNGQSAGVHTLLKVGDRIGIAGNSGLVLQIAGAPNAPLSERIGAPELAEYAKALEAQASLVDQWHKSLEARQADLDKREQELGSILRAVIGRGENSSKNNPIPGIGETLEPGGGLDLQNLDSPSDSFILVDNLSNKESILAESPEFAQNNWEDEGDSWEFLTHPETEPTPGQIETSAQYWPPADEIETPGETSPSDVAPAHWIEVGPAFGPLQEEPASGPLIPTFPATLELPGEIPGTTPLGAATEPTEETAFLKIEKSENTDAIQDVANDHASAGSDPAMPELALPLQEFSGPFPIEAPTNQDGGLIIDLSDPQNTPAPNTGNATTIEDSGPKIVLEIAADYTIPLDSLGSGEASERQSPPESWIIPLGEFLCSKAPSGNGPIEAIHASGTPKVFVEGITPGEPVGGNPPWEHENLPRELERQHCNETDYRVWEIPQGPGLMSLELPPVLGIWYRLVLQTVLGVRALHSAGRILGNRPQQKDLDWAVLEPSGLVKLYGPGFPGEDQATDLEQVGRLARNLWNKAFGQNAPQPEFIKDLLESLTGKKGTVSPMESLDQLAVELDRIGLRIRANPYAWAALLQKTFPGWNSAPSKRLSA